MNHTISATRPRFDAVVIGAGIVGLCCALFLQRDGRRVALVDPDAPGEGCSYGNAGLIGRASVVPISTPETLRRIPKMLFDRDSPVAIRWSHLPRLAPWLWEFIQAGRPARVEAIAAALAALSRTALDDFAVLLREARAEDLLAPQGYVYLYETPASFAAARPGHELRRRHGIDLEYLDADGIARLLPSLARLFHGGVHIPGNRYIVDPLALSQALARRFLAGGGIHLRDAAVVIGSPSDGGGTPVVTRLGRLSGDKIVVAAGARSAALARSVGCRVLLDTERGYHAMIRDPGVELARPIISADGGFAATPMRGGLRMTCMVELADIDAPPNFALLPPRLKRLARYLPGLRTEFAEPWLGCRPSMPDSLPVIGPAPGRPDTLFAFGHGHIGLTLGPTTGRIIADLVAGRSPGLDLAPLRADRFT